MSMDAPFGLPDQYDQKKITEIHESPSFTVFGSNFVGLSLVPERSNRVSGGDGEYYQHSNLLRNPLVVRSGQILDQEECVSSCPYRGKYQGQNSQQQDTGQYYGQNYQRTGHAPCQTGYYDNSPIQPCYAQQGHQRTQSQPNDSSGSDCGCDPLPGKRAYRTPSSHYMEFREFQQPPKKNPILDSPQYQRTNRLERNTSDCSCGSDSLHERQPVQRSKRLQRKGSVCSCELDTSPGRQQVKRTNRKQHKDSDCCYLPGSSPGRQRVQTSNRPSKSGCLKKPTPAAQTCTVHCHAQSHVHRTAPPPPPAPKRKCPGAAPPPTSRKPTPRSRSTNSTKRASNKRYTACNDRDYNRYSDGDYMERSQVRNEVHRNPLVQYRSSYDENYMLQESYSAEYVQRPSCSKPSTENRSGSRKGPPICSNETLMEKPVKSYRFSCPENGKCASCRKLCPKCNKMKPQKQKSAFAKRCVTSMAEKCCPMCGLLPMMPNISIPEIASSNRIIYKTLGRCRPRKVPKTRYELTICCKKRCQGGRNSHYMTGTIATGLKRRAKAVLPGGNQVAPSRMSTHRQGLRQPFASVQNETSHLQPTGHTRSPSRAAHSYVSQERSSPSGQPRERPAAGNLVQKSERRQSERESTPANAPQHRTRALSPIAEIHHHRGSFDPKEHSQPAHTYRSQPEPEASSYRSKPEPAAPSNISRSGPASSNKPDPSDLPPAYLAPASLEPEIMEPNRRAASYLGTEVNPFYRGSFLKVRCPRDSPPTLLSPIHQRGEKTTELPKPPRSPGIVLPVKYTRLSQLQAWVFGDPFVTGNENMGTWSWRQIFGRSKKPNKSAKPVEAKK
ncbi:serine/arginine repetitive matrix protein 1 isoform X2 [Drosophila elegans]|uniref:serine/arginine repetitive matrix protein 1 isoform X2 n=1 Tax=Drosophila elegans TaxID=30023 RepID=UPI001BC85FCF|nr:serine/arginine repetitive matrix protein 1 isoform X2 [Drosophila elegans]